MALTFFDLKALEKLPLVPNPYYTITLPTLGNHSKLPPPNLRSKGYAHPPIIHLLQLCHSLRGAFYQLLKHYFISYLEYI